MRSRLRSSCCSAALSRPESPLPRPRDRGVPDCAVLFKRLLREPRVPRRAKVALALVVPYLVMPFDLIPDFIPVLGQLDDALLVALVFRYLVRRAGRD
jgi:hypothetical protein